MIRVHFVFEDPFDDTGINLSYIDVPTADPTEALRRVAEAAQTGELWRNLYPDDEEHPYTLIDGKMTYLDMSLLSGGPSTETTLAIRA
jgi:hypothetical protein